MLILGCGVWRERAKDLNSMTNRAPQGTVIFKGWFALTFQRPPPKQTVLLEVLRRVKSLMKSTLQAPTCSQWELLSCTLALGFNPFFQD